MSNSVKTTAAAIKTGDVLLRDVGTPWTVVRRIDSHDGSITLVVAREGLRDVAVLYPTQQVAIIPAH